jgi:hypothetical protein
MEEVISTRRPLSDLPVGTRLILRTKTDWRSAVISRVGEDSVALRVCCSSGRVYWTKRASEMEVLLEENIFRLETIVEEDWRTNFAKFETRW